ncbi:signal peptidase I [Pseudohaliea rubra]|uniref:Signal peptidase I n=1 Tax=Pseudohaliea rubra DSM 19751 TaxID=1265313 RepID=A0A095VW30_9GAMM|nr:signal peptidase I [Pseudohaliea rubra]KGE05258.1 Signal peptidase I [Pseudohaliea rubra DSM 19751]
MSIDFPLILLLAVAFTGGAWLIDALLLAPARRRQGSEAGSEPVVVEYSKSFFPVLFAVFVLRSFVVEPFQIPSSSMVPTLEVGDYILVNKFTYGIRLPVLRTKVIDIGEPERGDVMVFFPPHMNKTYYIKRVIGIPGDDVTYRNKRLYVNGERVPQEPLAVVPGGRSRQRVSLADFGGRKHLVQDDLVRPSRDFSVTVRPGHYFMMGDNRDNSSDSRVWGQVSEQDIVGKAFAVWMHWDSLFSIPSFRRVGVIE